LCSCHSSSGDHRGRPSFPTRRSSDLICTEVQCIVFSRSRQIDPCHESHYASIVGTSQGGMPVEEGGGLAHSGGCIATAATPDVRSEEHTSELQSRENLVCRLLLEKKK